MLSTAANLINKLACEHDLSDAELLTLITSTEPDINKLLACEADKLRRQYYGDKVYIRGLIEFTNYCKKQLLLLRYPRRQQPRGTLRLTQEEILACCAEGYRLGFRTFVLQGGEDAYYTDDKICAIVSAIRNQHARLRHYTVHWRKKAVPAIRHTSMQAPTVICCATKQRMRSITPSCIQTA